MFRVPVALVLATAFVLPDVVGAQDRSVQDEIQAMRQQLGVDESVPITLAAEPRLPSPPLRVYLAVGLDTSLRDDVQATLRSWNKKHAKKHGSIELVDELESANVALVRCQRLDQPKTQQWSGTQRGSVYDPVAGVSREQDIPALGTSTVVPAYGYLLIREDGGFSVVYRYQVVGSVGDDRMNFQYLLDRFERLALSQK